MSVVTVLLATMALLVGAADAVAQSAQRPAPAAAGGTSNANTNVLSTGSNRNTNANSNSQFLSGNNTGVNNGTLEVYAGSDPYQGFVIEGSTNLPQLPGIPTPPSNFSQPYRPDAFVNNPPFLPAEIALEDAKRCRDAKASWYGGSRDGDAQSIKLFYAGKPESPPVALTMANYVGTAMATTSDGPFLAALCEAAYRAMRKGATVGIVEFNLRPKNTMFGFGFGSSGGATGLPAAGAHPYAIAATLGFGTGWSNQRVEGEVVLQLTGLDGPSTASAESSATTSASTRPPDRVEEATSSPAAPSSEPAPSTSPEIVPTYARQPINVKTTQPASSEPEAVRDAEKDKTADIVRQAQPTVTNVTYHPPQRLGRVHKGQPKDVVFGLFGTTFATRDGKVVEIQGMRLVASSQSAGSVGFEISEVSLAEEHGRATVYWFLFEKGRLLAWGRPEEWASTASWYKLALPYSPEAHPLRVEANVTQSGR